MGWASPFVQKLAQGRTVRFRPKGKSMEGRIRSGQLCTVEPVSEDTTFKVDEIVLCRIGGHQYLHLITAIDPPRYQIGNTQGHINGWVDRKSIFGRCIHIED